MDEFKVPGAPHDTSGLSASGKQHYDADHSRWIMQGSDPDSEPNIDNYEQKATVLNRGGGGGGGAGRSNAGGGGAQPQKTTKWAKNAQGQVIYQYTDGHWGP